MEVLEFELCLYDSSCFHSRPQHILCFNDNVPEIVLKLKSHLLSGSVVGGRDSVKGVEVILGAVVQLVLPRPVFCLYLYLYSISICNCNRILVFVSTVWCSRYLRKQA